jgi:hypothetical protein
VRLTVGTVEVARTVSLSGDGRTLTVEPGAGYVPSNSVSLTFAAQVTDLAGNRVDTSGGVWSWKLPYWIPWGTADGAPAGDDYDRITSYAFDNSGTLVAIWRIARGGGTSLYARRWERGEWKTYGNLLAIDSGSSPIHTESLLLSPNGNPIVAWSRSIDSNSSRIYVRRWTGSDWEGLGSDPADPSGLPQKYYLSLQWAPSGQPAIVWSESNNTQTRICTSHWDTTKWASIGACFDARTTSSVDINPILKFTADGTPIVSWTSSQPYAFDIYTEQRSGTGWTLLEGDRSTDVQGPYALMEIDATNRPVVAWPYPDGSGYHRLVVERWSGEQWQSLGRPLNPAPEATSAVGYSMQMDTSGAPLIAWTGNRVHVHRWNGEDWQPLDDFSNTEAYGGTNAGSLYRTNSGDIVLTWFRDMGLDTRIRVRRLNQ